MKALPPRTVAPLEPTLTEPPEHMWKRELELPGCLWFIIWIVLTVIGYYILSSLEPPVFSTFKWPTAIKLLYYLSPCIAAAAVLGGIIEGIDELNYSRNENRKEKAFEPYRLSLIRKAEEEARMLTSRVSHLLDESLRLQKKFEHLVKNSRSIIEKAQFEFERNASVFFWDHYEEAVDIYWQALEQLDRISASATDYYSLLEGRVHSFEQFPIGRTILDDVKEIRENLATLRRQAIERGGDFVVSWEHRRTRETIDRAFSSLEHAIREMDAKLDSTLDRFEKSLASTVAQSVIEWIGGRRSKH